MEMSKNKKGILFTLATIVLFVLMLSELMIYAVIKINYNTLASGSASASGATTAIATLSSGSSAFLHQSLQNALNSLIKYEGTPTLRKGQFVNNAAYALQSLMYNGVVYGTNMLGYMGGSTLSGFLPSMTTQVSYLGYNVLITNSTLTVSQSSPFTINANYTALAFINSSQGSFTYPLVATASVSLNSTQSLYGLETGDPFVIKPMSQYPAAVLIGNVLAVSGSSGYSSFSYGTAIFAPGTPSCSSVPSQYWSSNYILVTPSALDIQSNVCGMGGLVTYSTAINSVTPTVPYLGYSSSLAGSANVISANILGTSVLLSARGYRLLDISGLQSAIQNGYSFASPYTPSYLEWAQDNLTQRSRNGMFSLNFLNRQLASLNGANSIVKIPNSPSLSLTGNMITVTGWMEAYALSGYAFAFTSWAGTDDSWIYDIGTSGSMPYAEVANNAGSTVSVTGSTALSTNQWYSFAFVLNQTTVTYYINGAPVATSTGFSGTLRPFSSGPCQYAIGAKECGSGMWWNGLVSDVQVYSTALAPSQVQQLYEEGMDSIPISGNSLVGWWPLNGNTNDYSGNNNNGTATSVTSTRLNDYQGDPIWGGSLYNSNALNLTEGAMNCGTLAQCANTHLEHLYLANVSLSGTYSYALNESATLGLANSVIQK
jgi:hypothetical protein